MFKTLTRNKGGGRPREKKEEKETLRRCEHEYLLFVLATLGLPTDATTNLQNQTPSA
jgi:hypothetical protein